MAPGNRSSLLSIRSVRPMPMIHEDDTVPPPAVPARSSKRLTLQDPVKRYSGLSAQFPPPHSQTSDESAPDRKSEPIKEKIKDKSWVARRGGWYRLGLAIFLVICLAVGLGVGLGLGLKKRNTTDDNGPLPEAGFFPSGSWSFTAALVNTSTACSTNPTTFTCYPFTTYSNATASTSAATFHWVITPRNSYTYVISSSQNPFAPSFSDVKMTLHDGNKYTEHYRFNVSMNHTSLPTAPLVPGQNSAATCVASTTVMAVTLWTRMRATYPANVSTIAAPTAASNNFSPWPFRVEIAEVQNAAPGEPACRDSSGQSLGDFAAANGGACGCWYSNYGLAGSSKTAREWRG